MTFARKSFVLAAGAAIAVSAASLAQIRAQDPVAPRSVGETLVVENATVDWIEFSQVAALIEGTVKTIELDIGKTVEARGIIGYLHNEKAKIAVEKAELAAKQVAAINKAKAQKRQALSVVARNRNILKRNPNYVPVEDVEKAEADLDATIALIEEAEEAKAIAQADLKAARNQLEEHTIKAPFSGVVIKKLKAPNESVAAREAVVELGNLDKLRVFAYIPLESAYRVANGDEVELQVKISGSRGLLPIEQKRFRGVISFIDPQFQPVGETGVRIYADFKNENHELNPGLKGTLTVMLNTGKSASRVVGQAPAVPPRSTEPVVQAGGDALPALPPR
jgi:RND family efflux transporter MFP subunit